MKPMLLKEVFDDYAKARMQTLIEKGEIPSTIIGGFIDYFGDSELINCSKCQTPVYIRPWLAEIAKKHNIKVECMCCADPKDIKGQVAIDFAKIEDTLDKHMFKRFCLVVEASEQSGVTYTIALTPMQVTTLHGALALAMKHPEVKNHATYPVLKSIRQQLLKHMQNMGFTPEELQYLDTREV